MPKSHTTYFTRRSFLTAAAASAAGFASLNLLNAQTTGLGYYILDARDRLSYSELMAVILIIAAIGYGLDTVLRLAQRAFSGED
jgi:ABC-type nitrate/sulfonate/bicarbonate transport system permease component